MTIKTITIDTEQWAVVPRDVLDRFPEINPSNYDHDDACRLNAWGVELVLAAAPQPEQAQQPAPRPVPTSERLPTAADADVTESVWLFNKMVSKWYLYHWRDVETAYISHWQPTGLVRPAEPDGGAV